ncbi:MAG: adenosine deaminase family protein [Janthinobacterium lividum]
MPVPRRCLRLFASAALLHLSLLPPSGAQTVVPGNRSTAHGSALTAGELRATQAFNAARALGKPELYAFLKPMPKGGELHMHLSGAVYAETFIAEAAKQGLCVAPVEHGTPAVPQQPEAVRLVKPTDGKPGECGAGQVPAADALKRQPLYDDLIDSFSMRSFVPTEGISGHDQFFATFDRFSGLKAFEGEWLDEVATRAAAQNEQYLEIMNTPTFSHAAALGYKLGWNYDVDHDTHMQSFDKLRDQLLAAGLRDEVATDRREFADALASRSRSESCSEEQEALDHKSGQASLHGQDPAALQYSPNFVSTACSVQIRFLYQILRGFPPQQVFAQTLLGFEVAQAELESGNPLVVGLNFVMPEDGRVSMQDYHLQMLMLDYLHSVYPRVHISLHAGELAFGMVPPNGLSFHIREAIELGHAERIGHGMDVLYEDHPNDLLAEMAAKHIGVEVNLTSNDVILGENRTDHPLAAYRAAHVPIALSTDDEGVSRIDLTHEYVKAAEEQNLTYVDLKRSARATLEHSFMPGEDLWTDPDVYAHMNGNCSLPNTTTPTSMRPGSPACLAFLQNNHRAAMQWELERRFAEFEAHAR